MNRTIQNFLHRAPSALWPYPKIVAHRLCGTLAPENTLYGLEKSRAFGVRAVETDAMLTADGHLVLAHDNVFGRVIRSEGSVAGTALEKFLGLDAGSYFDPALDTVHPTTLSAALDWCAAHSVMMNLEIKPADGFDAATADSVAEVIAPRIDLDCTILVSSFSVESLRVIQRKLPQVPRGLLLEGNSPGWKALAQELDVRTVHPDWQYTTREFVHEAHVMGLGVMCYTIDAEPEAVRMIECGVDALCTNRPDIFNY